MLIKDKMTANPITVNVNDVISKASDLMTEKNLHRIPVIDQGKLVGLVTKGLITSKGVGGATSLSIFELNYLLNKTPVKDVMIKSKKLITIQEDQLLEDAASLMLKHDIGCLPVVDKAGALVGIITQNDLFRAFLDLLGWDHKGSRIEIAVKDDVGVIGEISKIFVDNKANISHIGVYRDNPEECNLVLRTNVYDTDKLEADLNAADYKVTSVFKVD